MQDGWALQPWRIYRRRISSSWPDQSNPDQATLHGLLHRLCFLALPLISVDCVARLTRVAMNQNSFQRCCPQRS
jgi:hypothetical protein